ncbi:MAG: hypothetical protein CMH56_14430 [Myxococcales bacterium]|nr:hypothetical protein [Myxococcales bacterium]
MSDKPRILIIGAGVGGLTAAACLSSQGYPVTVLEQASALGGKAAQQEVHGKTFDTGPSLLTMIDELQTIYAACGENLSDSLDLIPHEAAFRYDYADGVSFDVYQNFEQTLASVESALGAQPALELRSFVQYSQTIWENALPHFVMDQAPTLLNTLQKGWAGLRAVSKIDALDVMKRAIDKKVTSQHLRYLLYRYATYNGSHPAKAPATLNCIAHVELNLGGYGVKGGMHRLPQSLWTIAQKNGAELKLNQNVSRIIVKNKRVVGLEVNGQEEPCEWVVSNADWRHLQSTLCPEFVTGPMKRSLKAASTSAFNAVWWDQEPSQKRLAHSVLFPKNYEDEFEALFSGKNPSQPTVYLSDQTINHHRQPSDGGHLVFGMINAPDLSSAPQQKPTEEMVALMKSTAVQRGYLSPNAELLWSRNPQMLADRFPDSAGALYGLASNSWDAAFSRPGNQSQRVKGLYLASGTAHPGGGVPMAMISGYLAAQALASP